MPDFGLIYSDARFRRACMAELRPWLSQRGIRLVLFDDDVAAEDRALFDACVELPPFEQIEEAASVVGAWAREHELAALLAESECALLPGALASAQLGIPGIGLEAALLTTNKWLCRERLRRAGVPVPRFALASSAQDVRAFGAEHGYPLMLKATSSCMSRNVVQVRAPAGVDVAVAAMHARLPLAPDVRRAARFAAAAGLPMGCDPLRQFLVEEYFDGAQVEVDGIVARGQAVSFGVSDLVLSAGPVFFVEGYLFPGERPSARIEQVALDAVRALGLRDAGFCVELRVAADRVVVIEVNGRLGQDEGFAQMFRRALGVYPLQVWIDALLGGVLPSLRAQRSVALAYATHYGDGTIVRLPEPREGVHLVAWEGLRLYGPPHVFAFPHLAYALAEDARSSTAAFEKARASIAGLNFEIRPEKPEPDGASRP